MKFKTIEEKLLNNSTIERDEALFLYRDVAPTKLLNLANQVRFKKVKERRVSWQIDRNINYTNICNSRCSFCNFYSCKERGNTPFTLTLEHYKEKIDQLFEAGGDQLLLQGGLHPKCDITFFEELFTALKSYAPTLKLNALGPPEVWHIATISNLSIKESLLRLQKAGLDSLPGAGAEILSQRVRSLISPNKATVEQWVEVMKEAHRLNINTTATMVYGHIESIEERVEHLFTIREIQESKPEKSRGFTAFIGWPMQLKGSKLGELFKIEPLSPIEHLKMIALSRVILTNIEHIQVSWLTIGRELAKLALHSGGDDMGSIMIEEKVVSSAGAKHRMGAEEMQKTIKEAGFHPWLRNQDYSPYTPYQ